MTMQGAGSRLLLLRTKPTIDNIVLAVCSLLGGRRDISNITTRARFRNGNTTSFVGCQEVWKESLVEGSTAELDDGRNA